MDEYDFSGLLTQISQIRPARALGRVRSVDGTVIWVRGLAHLACIGDRVRLFRGGGALDGEVLRIRDDLVAMLPDEGPEGVSQGDRVAVLGPPVLAPSEAWIGRVIDPYGQPLDGRPLAPGAAATAVSCQPAACGAAARARPSAAHRTGGVRYAVAAGAGPAHRPVCRVRRGQIAAARESRSGGRGRRRGAGSDR